MFEFAALMGAEPHRPLVGGFIYEHGSEESTFVVNGVLLAITAAITWVWFRPAAPAATSDPPAV